MSLLQSSALTSCATRSLRQELDLERVSSESEAARARVRSRIKMSRFFITVVKYTITGGGFYNKYGK